MTEQEIRDARGSMLRVVTGMRPEDAALVLTEVLALIMLAVCNGKTDTVEMGCEALKQDVMAICLANAEQFNPVLLRRKVRY